MGKIFALVAILVSSLLMAHSRHAISYEGGDRFGDRLSTYAQARYLSYVTGIQFLYRPFCYTDQATIDFQALPYDEVAPKYRLVFRICSAKTLADFYAKAANPYTPPTLFIFEYAPTDISEWENDRTRSALLNIPWRDERFAAYLKQCLVPNVPIPDLRKEGRLNVADHVRTLSGADTIDTSIYYLPLKHPTLDYHKSQIKKVYEWNQKKPMHVFLFSDTKKPQELLAQFRNCFLGYDILFDIQFLDKPDTDHVIQDFFAMQKFNVIIATQSNFSMMAWRFGSPDMVIFPVHLNGKYPNTEIDRVQVISRKSDWFPYEMDVILKEERVAHPDWSHIK
ncbi:MAG TPA: hypothetical protein VLF94_03275 [Chlamydiales bacterium]|nr:hypothetical protein [Chlamydiales bacterium]